MEARLVNPVAGGQHLNFGFLLSEVVPSRHGSVTEEGDDDDVDEDAQT